MKKNIPLLVGIALPIIFIIIVSVFAFGPSLFIKPQHNFIYTTDASNYYNYNGQYANYYDVANGKIVLKPISPPVNSNEVPVKLPGQGIEDAPKLYLYDIKNNSTHQITLAEANKFSIDPGPTSDDGYNVGYDYNRGDLFDIFGGGSSNSGYFVSKGNAKKRLNGLVDDYGRYYYQGNFKFIGWIK